MKQTIRIHAIPFDKYSNNGSLITISANYADSWIRDTIKNAKCLGECYVYPNGVATLATEYISKEDGHFYITD